MIEIIYSQKEKSNLLKTKFLCYNLIMGIKKITRIKVINSGKNPGNIDNPVEESGNLMFLDKIPSITARRLLKHYTQEIMPNNLDFFVNPEIKEFKEKLANNGIILDVHGTPRGRGFGCYFRWSNGLLIPKKESGKLLTIQDLNLLVKRTEDFIGSPLPAWNEKIIRIYINPVEIITLRQFYYRIGRRESRNHLDIEFSGKSVKLIPKPSILSTNDSNGIKMNPEIIDVAKMGEWNIHINRYLTNLFKENSTVIEKRLTSLKSVEGFDQWLIDNQCQEIRNGIPIFPYSNNPLNKINWKD